MWLPALSTKAFPAVENDGIHACKYYEKQKMEWLCSLDAH